MPICRADREYSVGVDDQRNAFQRDRDRVLYSSAFHRLAGITQVVRAGEGDSFHTRQQHSYKVSQIGRRLAEKCCGTIFQNIRDRIHPEVVEAACLAHDLGHPPFGHAGEYELNRLVSEKGDPEGFEGNAQSFRIICKLAVRYHDFPGLNLTRATLDACLKYPWARDERIEHKAKKWGFYLTEKKSYEFAKAGSCNPEEQSLEAALMDWADDIAYSVHDLEDFHRCGLVPWVQLLEVDSLESSALISAAAEAWFGGPRNAEDILWSEWEKLSTAYFEELDAFLRRRYDGSRAHRAHLRGMTSELVGYLVGQTNIDHTGLNISEEAKVRVRLLKQITRNHAIGNPSLVAQQKGQARIVSDLFNAIYDNFDTAERFLPRRLSYLISDDAATKERRASDCIAGLSEREATELHSRLFGRSYGSVLDPIAR